MIFFCKICIFLLYNTLRCIDFSVGRVLQIFFLNFSVLRLIFLQTLSILNSWSGLYKLPCITPAPLQGDCDDTPLATCTQKGGITSAPLQGDCDAIGFPHLSHTAVSHPPRFKGIVTNFSACSTNSLSITPAPLQGDCDDILNSFRLG